MQIARKGLPYCNAFATDGETDEPSVPPPKVSDNRVLQFCMAVRTQDQEVHWVGANIRIEVMYFEVRLAVSLPKCEVADLATTIVKGPKQNPKRRGYTLVPLGHTGRDCRPRLSS